MFGIIIAYLYLYAPKPIVKETTIVIDTVSTSDSLRIADEVLINNRAKIEQYYIDKNGNWVKRPKIISKTEIETVLVYKDFNAAVFDTTWTNVVNDTLLQQQTFKLLMAVDTIKALHLQYNTSIEDKNKATAELSLQFSGIYDPNTYIWNGKVKSKYSAVTQTKYITKTITTFVPQYIEKTRTFWDRVSIGPLIGTGLDLKNKTYTPYFIGIGILYDLK